MNRDGSYRDSHKAKGHDYHRSFSKYPHRAMLWRLEQRVLRSIVREWFPETRPSHLDFACGTGRILEHLSGRVAVATGVDVAGSMLAVARANVSGATILECDITREDVLGDNEYDLITAFRFFPNAESSLRTEAITVLTRHLKPKGILVFNNHKNGTSLLRTIARLLGKDTDPGMSPSEVHKLVEAAGLRISRRYPLAILPLTDKRMSRHKSTIEWFEVVASKFPGASILAQNVVYVCQKNGTPSVQGELAR